MDTIIGAVIGTLGVALITGVLAFARERLNKADEAMKACREDITWYRDKLFPVLEKQQGVLESLQDQVEELKEEWK